MNKYQPIDRYEVIDSFKRNRQNKYNLVSDTTENSFNHLYKLNKQV